LVALGNLSCLVAGPSVCRRGGAPDLDPRVRCRRSSRPHELVLGPDGGAWFTEVPGAIGHVAPDGAITSYHEGLEGGYASGLIVGPDKDIWFGLDVDERHTYIGHIDASGQVTLSGTLRVDTFPHHLALGSDGNVWFGASVRDSIGYVNPLGAVTQFEIPGSPGGLVAAGGDMWFTDYEEGNPAIGKVVLGEGGNATIKLFHSGLSADSHPEQIVVGPDGNLWFTDSGAEAIGRVTAAGEIEEFRLGDTPVDIEPGSEGNLWFSAYYGIGRISTTGVVSSVKVIALGEGRRTQDVALGPEGDLWFAAEGNTYEEETIGTVGRITPAGQVTTYTSSLSPGDQPTAIVGGAGNDLWFANDGTLPTIGHIFPGDDTVTPTPAPSKPPEALPGPGRITLRTHRAKVGSHGMLRIPVSCSFAPVCAGWMTLTAILPRVGAAVGQPPAAVIGRRFFSLSDQSPTVIQLPLNRRGRHLLAARSGHLAATATFEVKYPGIAGTRILPLRLALRSAKTGMGPRAH
jgi:streptogramin lyase